MWWNIKQQARTVVRFGAVAAAATLLGSPALAQEQPAKVELSGGHVSQLQQIAQQRGLNVDDLVAAAKTYMPSGKHDEYITFASGGHSGQIFVIGVDPRMQGTGLGRALALAGLDLVHQRGIDTGMLFCAADNAPALKLYRSLGFTVHRLDRAYERDVQAREAAS